MSTNGPTRAFLIGAGASATFTNSEGVPMPLVSNFFECAYRAGFPEQDMCHNLLRYAARRYGGSIRALGKKSINLEELMTEVADNMEALAARRFAPRNWRRRGPSLNNARLLLDRQMVFLIKWTLLKIAGGGRSADYARLAAGLKSGDVVISFNYDLLLDRSLSESGAWFFNDGYGLRFDAAYQQGQWRYPLPVTYSVLKLLKLHGSLNWLYPQPPAEHLRMVPERTIPKQLFLHLGIEADAPQAGWYEHSGWLEPPDDIVSNVDLHSLIVPPLRVKSYEFFKHSLIPIWQQAADSLPACHEIISIGYSLPESDTMAINLLRNAISAGNLRRIVLVNRNPTSVDHYRRVLSFSKVELIGSGFSQWVSDWK